MRYCKSYANLNYGTKYLNSIHSIHHEIFIPARSSYLRDHDALCWISVCYNNLLIRKSKWCKSSNEKRHYLNHRDYRFLCYLERINELILIKKENIKNNHYSPAISLIWSRITAAFSNSQALIASSSWSLRSFKIISLSALVALLSFLTFPLVKEPKSWSKLRSVFTVSRDFTLEEAISGTIQSFWLCCSWIERRR